MNTRFKFRVWDTLNKSFIYPDEGYQGHFIIDLNGKFHNLQNGSGGDEYIVQQFTGLFDKNNKPIYEGDVVRCNCWQNGVERHNYTSVDSVKFYRGVFYPRYIHDECEDDWYSSGIDTIEVIGNVFENSDLLK